MTHLSHRTGGRRWPLVLAWCCVPVLLLGSSGCTRRFFRNQADKEVFSLLKDKSDDPRWHLDGFHVYPDPRSRFADITNPDKPPMPPDDPAAHDYSPNPQKPGKAGIARIEGLGYLALLDAWDVQNRAEAEQRKKEREKSAGGTADDKKEQSNSERKAEGPALDGKTDGKDTGKTDGKDAGKADGKDAGKQPSPDRPAAGDSAARDDGITSRLDELESTLSATDNLSAEQILDLAEARARRELAGVVTTKRGVPEKESEKAVSNERTFLIKMEQAVELGLINNREYQTRREQVYLAALPVTLERFAFAPQFFAAETAFWEQFGREIQPNPAGPRRRWRFESQLGYSQLFSTGALLLVSFANRTIINLTNTGKGATSVSNLSADLIQPLLYQGGRAVTLEPLTQAERSLLYVIRDFARFRQDFYVTLAGGQPSIAGTDVRSLGQDTTTVPIRFVPGPTPVVQPIILSPIAPQVTPGESSSFRAGRGTLVPTPNQGFLATLSEKAQLINQYRNIISLNRFLRRFRVYLEGGIVNSVQVGQVEQQMLRGIESALNQQASYRTSIDQFKLQLGLPMNLRLEVEDTPLEPMLAQTRRFENISNTYEEVSNRPLDYVRPEEAGQLRGRLRELLTGSRFVGRTRFQETISDQLRTWEQLTASKNGQPGPLEQRLETLIKDRDRLRERRDQLLAKEKGRLSADEERELLRLEFQIDLGRYEQALRSYERRIWEAEKDPYRRQTLQNLQFNVVYRLFLSLLEEAFRERTERVRRLWPDLPPVCIDGVDLLRDCDDVVLATVTRAALENRLDLMNQRALVVDSWRQIRVAANALLGTFTVQYHFDAFTPFGQSRPFNFSGTRSTNQLAFNVELPIVRIAQRNAYRATLIAYQQQRRDLIQAEDQVVFQSRQTLRQLRASANSYHNVQKRAVELAYIQVDQALQAFSQPQQPTGPALPTGAIGPPTSGGSTGDPAALTQQLLQNQNSLLQAQNTLYNTWISYLINRMSLYRDVGLMPIDPRGVWIDDVESCRCPPALPADRQPADQSSSPAPSGDRGGERSGDELPAPRSVEEGGVR